MADYSKLRTEVLARFEGSDYIPGGPPVFAWHVHHGILVEPLRQPISDRIDYVIADKPEPEIETRLRWLRPVTGPLPVAFIKAGAAYTKTGAAYDQAGAAYDKAGAECDKAMAECDKAMAECDKAGAAYAKAGAAYAKAGAAYATELETLHAAELPDCPWNGHTLVFPEESRT